MRKLLKSLYGTPDALQIWYTVLSEKFSTLQLKQSSIDACLLFSKNMDIWIIVHVDDLIIATKTIEAQQVLKQFLLTQFKMKETGLPIMFLGMNLDHHPEKKSIILHQNTYINNCHFRVCTTSGKDHCGNTNASGS